MIKKLLNVYNYSGLDGIVFTILKKLGFNIKYLSIIEKKKYILEKKIISISKQKIISGFYKGVYLNYNKRWGAYASKLLGLYELQIQRKINELKNKYKLNYFVNFGAGEGFHIIGSTKNFNFKKSLAFEIDLNAQKILKKNLMDNKVQKKVNIFGAANFKLAQKVLENKKYKTIFLIDIEGAEYDLINKDIANYLKYSFLIIEDHRFWIKNNLKIKKFDNLLKQYFNVEILLNSERNPYGFRDLTQISDDERWLIMSENRPKEMQWLVCIPKDLG